MINFGDEGTLENHINYCPWLPVEYSIKKSGY